MKDSVCFSKQNGQPFKQIGAFGDEKTIACFSLCLLLPFESAARNVQNGFTQSMLVVKGSFSLFTSQIKRENEHKQNAIK